MGQAPHCPLVTIHSQYHWQALASRVLAITTGEADAGALCQKACLSHGTSLLYANRHHSKVPGAVLLTITLYALKAVCEDII